MRSTKVYKELASRVDARINCIIKGNHEWENNHKWTGDDIVKSFMPSGSGIDTGTKLDWDASRSNKLVFEFSYHHMNDGGMYDGWTDHKCIVTPNLLFGFDVKITGKDRNGIKEYLHECFSCDLDRDIVWDDAKECYVPADPKAHVVNPLTPRNNCGEGA